MNNKQEQWQELEDFIFKGKHRNAVLVEGLIIWKHQTFLDFLEVNKDFYGNTEYDQAKRDFWLERHEIHHTQAFRSKMVRNKRTGKMEVAYANRQPVASEIPCRWEIKIYCKELDYPITLYKSFFDHDSARTIEEFLSKDILQRIDPNGTIRKQRSDQTFSKALILDRKTDKIVFQYPEQGFMLPDVETARQELKRVAKHFREKQSFPPQEHYSLPDVSEQEFKATPKIFKEDTTDYSHIFLQMKESMYSELVRLGLVEYIADVANIKFHSFRDNSLKCFIDSKEQFDKLEEDKFLVVFRSFQIRFFGESVKLEYALKTPIQKSETQPKIDETQAVEVERSEVVIQPKALKAKAYYKNPDKVFNDMMIDFARTVSEKPIEFDLLKMDFHDVDKMKLVVTLPSMDLIEAFNLSVSSTFFRLIVKKYFDSTYFLRLRHEEVTASFIGKINRI